MEVLVSRAGIRCQAVNDPETLIIVPGQPVKQDPTWLTVRCVVLHYWSSSSSAARRSYRVGQEG